MELLVNAFFQQQASTEKIAEDFLGVEGATSLKAEIVGRVPVLNTPAQYREARQLLLNLGGMKSLRAELVYSGFVDPLTRTLNTGFKPYNVFARLAAGVETQEGMKEEQAALGEYQKYYMICRNLSDNDRHWDSKDALWKAKASMSKRHRFLTTKTLDWKWFNPIVFGMQEDSKFDSDQIVVRDALAEVERMKAAALTYVRSMGDAWSDKIGLFFHVFGHNRINSLILHILDLSVVGPSFEFQQYKNLPLDDVITVLREETTHALRPTVPTSFAKRKSTVEVAKFMFRATDGATSIKEEMVSRMPLLRDASSFRVARRILVDEFGGIAALKQELVRSNFVDEKTDCLTVGTSPFNVFARVGAGVMKQPGMEDEQLYLGEYKEKFVICCNKPENDDNWDSEDPAWVGKSSMSKRHRFLTTKDMKWEFFNGLTIGLMPTDNRVADLDRGIQFVHDIKLAALTYAKECPGWSDKVGLFLHIFGHNSVNSMHLHVVDMSVLGPTFWYLDYKNIPLDAVLKVLREERAIELEKTQKLAVETAKRAAIAKGVGRAATTDLPALANRSSSVVSTLESDDLLELNVGGHLVCAWRSALLMAPKDSLMFRMFAIGSVYLNNEDSQGRPYLDMPGPAFACIADHFRLLRLTPPHLSVGPASIPDDMKQDVMELAWVLGVSSLLAPQQVGRAQGQLFKDTQNLLPRPRPGCCARRKKIPPDSLNDGNHANDIIII